MTPVRRTWLRRRSLLLGISVLMVFALALFIALNAASGLPGSSGTRVKASFANVSGLFNGNDVRIAGVRVGQVKEIELKGGKALVTMQLDDHRPVYANATALVSDKSALGEKYISLAPGDSSAERLDSDVAIAEKKTRSSQNLSDLLAVFDKPTRDGLQSTLRETGTGAASHTEDVRSGLEALPEELPDLGTVSKALSADSGADTTQLLHAANDLAKSLKGDERDISGLMKNLDTTLKAVDVEDGMPLDETLDKAPDTLVKTRGALRDLQTPLRDTRSAVTTLGPGAEALGQSTPDVRGVLREGVTPLRRLPGVADKATPAVTSLTPTLRDARPVVPLVTEALNDAEVPLAEVAPYAPELSSFFTRFASALQYGDEAGHWLRIYPPVGTEVATGLLGLKDPTVKRDAYAPPGEATGQSRTTILGDR
ncbi:Mammalian cell entry related domain protein [Streptomyces albus]|uniref:Mammalian cell entry related domain protein n=1 Tax=Streptomyces albus (strain ATCC 21838 / DSM 41398 / FERM P-419 / JCM 4703 / NBRC 107858) TaxID=1081613 RepID=A0A0B5F9V1_STRA4|nr:Mammalian cell entry related domain protein [Streptomyces albus]AOU81560.1 Mammalian cell entry related domain protein [Streptomyces albus]AYN37253.1 MCE family protein [Streptomyces albus]